MSRIRKKDTKPELLIRSLIHRMGYRFRLHRSDLPGTPDVVFPRLNKIVLVHGCFWHVHTCRPGRVQPVINAEYWKRKREGNVRRDRKNLRRLRSIGWKVLVVWECETKDEGRVLEKLRRFLGNTSGVGG